MTSYIGGGKVEFRFYRPDAHHVDIAGDFNGWRSASLRMHPEGDGWWVAQAPLPPGEYRFRYVADGTWYTDFASNGVERGPGGWNGVLVVPKVPPRRTRQPQKLEPQLWSALVM